MLVLLARRAGEAGIVVAVIRLAEPGPGAGAGHPRMRRSPHQAHVAAALPLWGTLRQRRPRGRGCRYMGSAASAGCRRGGITIGL